MENKTSEKSARLSIIVSMLIYGTIGLVRRYLPLSSSLIALARSVIGCAFIVIFTYVRGKKIGFGDIRRNIAFLLPSGVLLGFNWILLFEAYNYTSVASATLCYYLAPVFIILAAPVIFGEKLTPLKIICALVALLGMIPVSGMLDGGQVIAVKGIFFGVASAVMYAVIVILNKKLTDIRPADRTAFQLFVSSVVLTPYTILTGGFNGAEFTFGVTALLVLAGILHTGIAYMLYFGALDRVKANTAAILSYIDPVTAIILSAVVLGESITIWTIVGAVMILGAAAVSELKG